MEFFIIEHAPSGDVAREYGGMTKEVVEALVAENGNPFEFVTKQAYAEIVATSRTAHILNYRLFSPISAYAVFANHLILSAHDKSP